ncbi:MAG: zinc ribbon domain-containing protein, partial [Anaerolineales bacterium]|nr:zinc ribbon domain-containing protein [Anaerolineales bacterium]
MAEIRCPQCNAPNRETARYCAECGALLQANAPTPDRETKLLENSRPAGDSPVDERPEAHLSHPNLLR